MINSSFHFRSIEKVLHQNDIDIYSYIPWRKGFKKNSGNKQYYIIDIWQDETMTNSTLAQLDLRTQKGEKCCKSSVMKLLMFLRVDSNE